MSTQKKPTPLKPLKGWVIVDPIGCIDINTTALTRSAAWRVFQSDYLMGDIIEAKRAGYRAVRVTITVTPC